MALYDGFPSVRIEGNRTIALEHLTLGKKLLASVQQFKEKAGVPVYARAISPHPDVYIHALSIYGQEIIFISAAPVEVDTQFTPSEFPPPVIGPRLPSIYSGVVLDNAELVAVRTANGGRTVACRSFKPTAQTKADHRITADRLTTARLAVRASRVLPEITRFAPQSAQYAKLRSSMYSGTMAKVVQAVMGYGRLGLGALRESQFTSKNWIRRTGQLGVQVTYDYKYFRTHGVVYSNKKKPILIEISLSAGVWAMPLPIYPDRVARRAANKHADIKSVYDELGFLPSGGPMLRGSRWSRQLITAEELQEKIGHLSPYSTAMGWCFNKTGTEAHMTGYSYEESGYQSGEWWQLNISPGSYEDDGDEEGVPSTTASLVKVDKGDLYSAPAVDHSAHTRYLPFKVHEPMLPGLLSHNAVPTRDVIGSEPPLCDTVVHVYFTTEDELVALRLYHDVKEERQAEWELENNSPRSCPYNTSWTTRHAYDSKAMPRMMYSNLFDDRRAVYGSEITTNSVSVKTAGPIKCTGDLIEAPEWSRTTWQTVYQRSTVTTIKSGERLRSMVMIPEYTRCGMYYATHNVFDGGKTIVSGTAFGVLRSNVVHWSWRCWPRVSVPLYIPCVRQNLSCGGKCRPDGWHPDYGKPVPGTHKQRKVICAGVQSSACSQFASAGSLGGCAGVSPGGCWPGQPGTSNVQRFERDARAEAYYYDAYGDKHVLDLEEEHVDNVWIRTVSPLPSGPAQRIRASASMLGEEGAFFDSTIRPSGNIRFAGRVIHEPEADETIPCFIGVIT